MQYGELDEVCTHESQFEHDGSVEYDIYDGYEDNSAPCENEIIPF